MICFRLSSVAENSLTNIKEMSATGLQHTIDQHTHLDVKISIHAPICILPYQGRYTGSENALIVNLGLLTVNTEERKKSLLDVRKMYATGANEEEILQEMIAQSYDQFKVSIRGGFENFGGLECRFIFYI